MTMRAGRNSRNADFISIAAERQSATLGAKGPVKLKNLPAVRPVHLKNPHTEGVSKLARGEDHKAREAADWRSG